jgi:PAS domain S-box-containing protein
MSSQRLETILVLEDDEGVARLQQRRLERAGYRVVVAGNSRQALELLREGGIDLLVFDNQLAAGEDGLGFYMKLKDQGCELPVVLVTGYSDDATLIRALRAGVRDYLFKSVEYLDYLPEACERILEQLRVKRALADSQARFSAVVHSALDGIITLGADHHITLFNPAAERVFGCPAESAVGCCISRYLPGGLPAVNPGQGVPEGVVEIVGRRADGTDVPLEVSLSRLEIPGQVICTLILRDITERKRSEERLRKTMHEREKALSDLKARTEELRTTTQQLWQAARLAGVGELAASIAHELNNPLGIVSLRVEGVLARTPPEDPRRRPLEIVEQEVERMARLVSNLLHFSRAGRDQVSTVDVCEEVSKTIELTEHHLERRRVKIEPDLAGDVPLIYADRQQLRQVFLNLFTNAGDAMPQGGRLIPRVRRGELPGPKPAVVIEVIDTGVGIRPEHLPRVAEPFFTTKEEGKGTGLGLAICRRIIEQHHGRLELESKVGEGTTVRVLLPVKNGTNASSIRDR